MLVPGSSNKGLKHMGVAMINGSSGRGGIVGRVSKSSVLSCLSGRSKGVRFRMPGRILSTGSNSSELVMRYTSYSISRNKGAGGIGGVCNGSARTSARVTRSSMPVRSGSSSIGSMRAGGSGTMCVVKTVLLFMLVVTVLVVICCVEGGVGRGGSGSRRWSGCLYVCVAV